MNAHQPRASAAILVFLAAAFVGSGLVQLIMVYFIWYARGRKS